MEKVGELCMVGIGNQRRAQNDLIRRDLALHAVDRVENRNTIDLSLAGNDRRRVGGKADKTDARLKGAAIVTLQDRARRHDVPVENRHLGSGIFFLDQRGVFDARRAAECGAVRPLRTAGADALDENRSPRRFFPLLAASLELHERQDPLQFAVPVKPPGQPYPRPRRQDHRADMKIRFLRPGGKADLEIARVARCRCDACFGMEGDQRLGRDGL